MIQEIHRQPQISQIGIDELSRLIGISLIASAVLLLFIITIWLYTGFYVITPNNEAFVRVGGVLKKSKSVILNGGCLVLPGFHKITRVPLREISIDVVRSGNLAIRTQDYLRANMQVTFYVYIEAIEENVSNAASRLSKQGKVSESDIKEALEKRADNAIRAAAKRKTIAEIDSDQTGFSQEVFDLIQDDLKKVGLTLNTIAISEIEESNSYDENNFFDAQGIKLRTAIVQGASKQRLDVELKTYQEKKELELNTKIAVEQKELEAEKLSLEITKEIEYLKAQQQREIQENQAQEMAKIEKIRILQERAVEEERIQNQLAVQQNQIEANTILEEQNKQLKVATTLQLQEAEIAEITRQKTVEASRIQARAEIALAEQEAEIAIANKEKERFKAQAQKVQAEASIITATEVEKAEREKRLSLITADQETEKRRIIENNLLEIEVFRRRRQAEIDSQVADLEADSIRTLADAHRYQALAETEAKLALIEAENVLSDANRMADLIKTIWPELAPLLPEILRALAPQPGILGDAQIYAFPGFNTNNDNGSSSTGDLSQLLASISGLSLINTLLDQGKLGTLIAQIKDLLTSKSDTPPQNPTANFSEAVNPISASLDNENISAS